MDEWKRYYCPFCKNRGHTEDVRGKLYINWKSHYYLCFRCNKNGNTKELESVKLVEYNGSTASTQSVDIWDPRRFVNYTLDEVETYFPEVYSFLKRKNALKHFKNVSLVFFSYGYGLVIPLENDLYQIKIFSRNENAPKYLTMSGLVKNKILLGINELKSDLVIFVEGIFDYYRLEGYAVCMLGRFISNKVVERLISRGQNKFLVLWDADSHQIALNDALKIWRRYLVDVYAGFCLEGSPSDCDVEVLNSTPCLRIVDGTYLTLKRLKEQV